jgi:hypothetical protein
VAGNENWSVWDTNVIIASHCIAECIRSVVEEGSNIHAVHTH